MLLRIKQQLWRMVAAIGAIIYPPPPTVISITSTPQSEGAVIPHNVILSGTVIGIAASYPFSITAGMATAGADYSATPIFTDGVVLSGGNVTVPAGVVAFSVLVTTLTDTLFESTEAYTITIGGVSDTGSILDANAAPSISSVSSSGAYEGGNIYHNVVVNGVSASATVFPISLGGVTATGGGVDYTSNLTDSSFNHGVTISGANISVPPGVTAFTVSVPTTLDSVVESTETYTLTIGTVSGVGSIYDQVTGDYGATADAGEVDVPWGAPAWSAGVPYEQGTAVSQGGTVYWARADLAPGVATTDTASWQQIMDVYYMDSVSGLDTYDGRSMYPGYVTNADGSQGTANAGSGPWQTMFQLSTKIMQEGKDLGAPRSDTRPPFHAPWVGAPTGSMFLFKRGCTFDGVINQGPLNSSGVKQDRYSYGAYGVGARPVITCNNFDVRSQYAYSNGAGGTVYSHSGTMRLMNLHILQGTAGNMTGVATCPPNVGSYGWTIRNCTVEGHYFNGILFDGGHDLACRNNLVVRNMQNPAGQGAGVSGNGPNIRIQHNTLISNGKHKTFAHNIYCNNLTNSIISDNYATLGANTGIVIHGTCSGLTIARNDLYANSNGMDISGYGSLNVFDNTVVAYNLIHGNGYSVNDQGYGIMLKSLTNSKVFNNKVWANRLGAFILSGSNGTDIGTTNLDVVHNTFVDTSGCYGSIILGATIISLNFQNNIISSQDGNAAVTVNSDVPLGALTLRNNLYYVPNRAANTELRIRDVNYSVASAIAAGHDAGSIYGNPLFTNFAGNDLTLQDGSPAHWAAAGIVAGVTTDFAGTTRHVPPSIGCYE